MEDKGVALISALLVMVVLSALGMAMATLLLWQNRVEARVRSSTQALYLAEAGAERALVENLKDDPNQDWSDNEVEELYPPQPLGGGSYTVSLRNGTKEKIDIFTWGNYRGEERSIKITVRANWGAVPPTILLSDWEDLSLEKGI